jgi:hypothetical protein
MSIKLAQDWASQGEWEEAMEHRHTCRDPHSCSSSVHRDDEERESEQEAYEFAMHESHACDAGCSWGVADAENTEAAVLDAAAKRG